MWYERLWEFISLVSYWIYHDKCHSLHPYYKMIYLPVWQVTYTDMTKIESMLFPYDDAADFQIFYALWCCCFSNLNSSQFKNSMMMLLLVSILEVCVSCKHVCIHNICFPQPIISWGEVVVATFQEFYCYGLRNCCYFQFQVSRWFSMHLASLLAKVLELPFSLQILT